jgi:hypothetical protein
MFVVLKTIDVGTHMKYLAAPVDWLSLSRISNSLHVAQRTNAAIEALRQLPTALFEARDSAWIRECRRSATTTVAAMTQFAWRQTPR